MIIRRTEYVHACNIVKLKFDIYNIIFMVQTSQDGPGDTSDMFEGS